MWVVRSAILTVLALVWTLAIAAQEKPVEEIPLERCDVLPVVTARIGGINYRLLVDTAATSILNLRSFARGAPGSIQISSWSGPASTSAREVSVAELSLGRYKLQNLKLPAVDLSPIGKACGGQIDGILGVDLLEKMGATIDLQRRIARLGPSGGTSPSEKGTLFAGMNADMDRCVAAFNAGKSDELTTCFDPEFVLYTPWGEYHGRDQVIEYLRSRYFRKESPARLEMKTRDARIIGDALWHAYDYAIEMASLHVKGRGMSICRKADGHWRLLNMHHSILHPEPALGSAEPTKPSR